MDILAAAETIARAQPRVGPLLEGLAASGKLPPSLIFAGPEGSGKELMAVRLAALLNCEGSGGGKSCGPGGRCPACSKTGSDYQGIWSTRLSARPACTAAWRASCAFQRAGRAAPASGRQPPGCKRSF